MKNGLVEDSDGYFLNLQEYMTYWTWRVGQKVLYKPKKTYHEIMELSKGDGVFKINSAERISGAPSVRIHYGDLIAVSEDEYAAAKVVEG